MVEENKNTPFYKKAWVWVIAVIAVIVVVVGAYLLSQPKKVELKVVSTTLDKNNDYATDKDGDFGMVIKAPAGSKVKIIDTADGGNWPTATVKKNGKVTTYIHIDNKTEFTNIKLKVKTKHTYSDPVRIKHIRNIGKKAVKYRNLQSYKDYAKKVESNKKVSDLFNVKWDNDSEILFFSAKGSFEKALSNTLDSYVLGDDLSIDDMGAWGALTNQLRYFANNAEKNTEAGTPIEVAIENPENPSLAIFDYNGQTDETYINSFDEDDED